MDLELATTDDILNELRQRGMRFVFIGEMNSNSDTGGPKIVAAQAVDRRDVGRLIRFGLSELLQMNDDRIGQE